MGTRRLPQTIAYVRLTCHSWQDGRMAGEVMASQYVWQFEWHFKAGTLRVTPSLGRSLILDPLSRFLEQQDYRLELGSDYSFLIRADF